MRLDRQHLGHQRLGGISRSRQRGVTLVETVLSLLIIGGAYVALLNTVGSARTAYAASAQRQLGMALAEDLMAEILAQTDYEEGNAIGTDSGESNGDRNLFDDIDDYDGWAQRPPVDVGGAVIAGAEGYTREVEVVWVDNISASATRSSDEGTKRITVTVKRGGKPVATLIGYRTNDWVSPEQDY